MQLTPDNFFHLTYCTNIHPSNGWAQVRQNLERYTLALKNQLAPTAAFGIGLRLSGEESRQLLENDSAALTELQDFLQTQNLYVFTLNGFPYGSFHDQPVKDMVHAPDWRDTERVDYTLRLIKILAALLPDGLDGGISTSPLSYRAWVNSGDKATWQTLNHNLLITVQAMVEVKNRLGKIIHLDLEPEPDGLLNNNADLLEFYSEHLLECGAQELAARLGVGLETAREHIREHIRVCLDTCHMAVSYEEPATVLARYKAAGIKIGKVQISSALKVNFEQDTTKRRQLAQALAPYAESTYLHQVVQRNLDGSLFQYSDLNNALPHLSDPQIAQWRIHFHVPIFIKEFPAFQSTQDAIVETLQLLKEQRFTRHLEIETYTWGVLPGDLKKDLLESISREYNWVLRNWNESNFERAAYSAPEALRTS